MIGSFVTMPVLSWKIISKDFEIKMHFKQFDLFNPKVEAFYLFIYLFIENITYRKLETKGREILEAEALSSSSSAH